MPGDDSYELTFERFPADSPESAADVVIVHRTGTSGPGGHPVYSDDSGIVRAEISDRGEIRMLPSGTHQEPTPPSALRRIPSSD